MAQSGRSVLGPDAFALRLHQPEEAKHLSEEAKHLPPVIKALPLVIKALQDSTSRHWVELIGKKLLKGKSMVMLESVLSIASLCDHS